MMKDSVYPLKIAKDNQCGLCNQLYALTGCIDHAIYTQAYNVIVIDSFLKEINTHDYCPVSEILDLDKMNAFLESYHIRLVDSNTMEKKTNPCIYYGTDTIHLDVTKTIMDTFMFNNVLTIPKTYNLNTLLTDPCPQTEKELVIQTNIHAIRVKESHGFLQRDICLDVDFNTPPFKPSPQLYFGGSRNPPVFVDILKHISFCPSFIETHNLTMDTLFTTWLPMETYFHTPAAVRVLPKFNLIHLRLEDDAVQSFSRQLNISPLDLKKQMERKYIAAIQKYIQPGPDEYTVVIANDYDNGVIRFLQSGGYNYKTTVKVYATRECNAIHDLLFARYCNHVFIGVYESSYSYTVMYRMFNETYLDSKAVILKMTEIDKPETVFDKHASIHDIRNG